MSTEDNKALALRIVECFNTGDLETLDKLVDEDALPGHDTSGALQLGLPIVGNEPVKRFVAMFRTAFSDLHFDVEQVVAEGDLVAVRAVMTGTNDGRFLGMMPSWRQIRVEGIHIMRFADGRVVQHWGLWDRMGLMQQLDLVEKVLIPSEMQRSFSWPSP